MSNEVKNILKMLEIMANSANELVEDAKEKYDETNRDTDYASVRYFMGYKKGIDSILENITFMFSEVEA